VKETVGKGKGISIIERDVCLTLHEFASSYTRGRGAHGEFDAGYAAKIYRLSEDSSVDADNLMG
jgi:hypothetical protein